MTRQPTKFQIMRRNREDHERLQRSLVLRRAAIESGYDVDSDLQFSNVQGFYPQPPAMAPAMPARRAIPTFAELALRWRFWR